MQITETELPFFLRSNPYSQNELNPEVTWSAFPTNWCLGSVFTFSPSDHKWSSLQNPIWYTSTSSNVGTHVRKYFLKLDQICMFYWSIIILPTRVTIFSLYCIWYTLLICSYFFKLTKIKFKKFSSSYQPHFQC